MDLITLGIASLIMLKRFDIFRVIPQVTADFTLVYALRSNLSLLHSTYNISWFVQRTVEGSVGFDGMDLMDQF